MNTITIARKMGSLGEETGQEVAERLSYEYVSKAKVKELLSGYGIGETELAMFDEKRSTAFDSHLLQRRNFVHLLNAAIYDVARKGRAVIVGRGAQFLLQSLPEVYHVNVFSPLNIRIQRVMAESGVDEKEAVRILRQSDRDIEGYSHYFFHSNGSVQYDLELNTEELSAEACAHRIIEGAANHEKGKAEENIQERLTDLALSERVEAGLFRKLGTKINYLDVNAEQGVVSLKGVVASDLVRQSCEWLAAGFDGVAQVKNDLISASWH